MLRTILRVGIGEKGGTLVRSDGNAIRILTRHEVASRLHEIGITTR